MREANFIVGSYPYLTESKRIMKASFKNRNTVYVDIVVDCNLMVLL